jgi:hypothetical protein
MRLIAASTSNNCPRCGIDPYDAFAVDAAGSAYVTGVTGSSNLVHHDPGRQGCPELTA